MVENPTFANNTKPQDNGSKPETRRVEMQAPPFFVWGNTFISPDQAAANQVSDAIVERVTQHKS